MKTNNSVLGFVSAMVGYFTVKVIMTGSISEFFIGCITIGLAGLIMWAIYYSKYSEYNKVSKILFKENNPTKYLEISEKVINTLKNEKVVEELKFLRAVAYGDLMNFDKAKEALDGIDRKKFFEKNNLRYECVMAEVLFHLGEEEKAIEIIKKNQRQLKNYVKFAEVVESALVLDILKAIYENKYNEGKMKLENLKRKRKSPRLKVKYDYLDQKLASIINV